ncbi:Uu.00g076690.m01.CDS01 [Anthostomella pinea]|uniref:Uu.00g076690.m01.CDS01 n=1 Tax=Anthostomella pinea TaxID=933095 RepID=A0AAI8VWM4_9PEZI|nr:Uu.00g076690.m01.CDS01 [Anthostomella pinea]
MLQRPRHLLTVHDTPHLQPTPPAWTYHHQPLGAETRLIESCRINSFTSFDRSWNAAKALLVTKWKKAVFHRRFRGLKRSMVKQLALSPEKKSRSQSRLPNSNASGVSITTAQALAQGSEPCLTDLDELNTVHDGSKTGGQSNRRSTTPVDPMESNNKASAARRSSHCPRDKKGERKQTPEQYVALKRQEAVERVMAAFNKWLDKRLAIISYAYEASEASEGTTEGSSKYPSDGSGKSSTSSKRPKRQFEGDGQDNFSAGGDENGKDRAGNKRAKKEVELERKWACPFYKHDPEAHSKHRSCAGPGWPSLHRLKEHLYRIHRLPKHTCPRCTEPFEDAKDLQSHLRADEPCKTLELVPVQGIDEATEAKLRIRKKHGPGVTEEQRWKEIYLILFPDANRHAVPNPYYDSNDPLALSKRVDRFRRVEKRIKKELPQLVQKRVERKFENVQIEVLHNLNDIIRDGLLEFFKGLPRDDRSPSVTPAATPRATTPGLNSSHEPSPMDEAKNVSMDLSTYFDDPDLPLMHFGGFDNFDFSAEFNFDSSDGFTFEKVSDSGYASTSTARGSRGR